MALFSGRRINKLYKAQIESKSSISTLFLKNDILACVLPYGMVSCDISFFFLDPRDSPCFPY